MTLTFSLPSSHKWAKIISFKEIVIKLKLSNLILQCLVVCSAISLGFHQKDVMLSQGFCSYPM
jgi:hypothetical protein